MSDYTPNPWILDQIKANQKWMNEMMNGMPTECLTSCANEIESLRAELAKRTEECDQARLKIESIRKEIDSQIGYYRTNVTWCGKDTIRDLEKILVVINKEDSK